MSISKKKDWDTKAFRFDVFQKFFWRNRCREKNHKKLKNFFLSFRIKVKDTNKKIIRDGLPCHAGGNTKKMDCESDYAEPCLTPKSQTEKRNFALGPTTSGNQAKDKYRTDSAG